MDLKKNATYSYIGLVVERCLIFRLMWYACFKANPTAEIYKSIHVETHVLLM